jgi:hypothetical protein
MLWIRRPYKRKARTFFTSRVSVWGTKKLCNLDEGRTRERERERERKKKTEVAGERCTVHIIRGRDRDGTLPVGTLRRPLISYDDTITWKYYGPFRGCSVELLIASPSCLCCNYLKNARNRDCTQLFHLTVVVLQVDVQSGNNARYFLGFSQHQATWREKKKEYMMGGKKRLTRQTILGQIREEFHDVLYLWLQVP